MFLVYQPLIKLLNCNFVCLKDAIQKKFIDGTHYMCLQYCRKKKPNWSTMEGYNLLSNKTCTYSLRTISLVGHLLQPHCHSCSVINSLNIELNNDTKLGLLNPTV